METLGKLFGAAFTFAGFMFVACIMSTLFGALSGLVVGWCFGDTILSFFAAIGIGGLKMWQIGATLGFIGGFFRSSVKSSRD